MRKRNFRVDWGAGNRAARNRQVCQFLFAKADCDRERKSKNGIGGSW